MGQVWESWGAVLVAWAIGVVVMPVIVASLAWYRIGSDESRFSTTTLVTTAASTAVSAPTVMPMVRRRAGRRATTGTGCH